MSGAVDINSCRAAVDVTPHDTNSVPIGRGLHVGVGGTVAGRLVDSNVDQTFTFAGGVVHPYVFQFIRSTGTSATGLKIAY